MSEPRIRVMCANCGWTSKRKPGNIVQCPKCGSFAAYQPEDRRRHHEPGADR